MRVTSDEFDAEVAGTTAGDRLEVHAWRGSELLAPDLAVSSWSLGWDADAQIQGQGSFTFADPDGTLAPWSLADPLGPGGSRLQVTWISGMSGTRVPLGWWRIRKADPAETWRVVQSGAAVLRVAGGGSVSVEADEETASMDLARMDAAVVREATVVAEVRRLVKDICPVVVDDDVVDGPVPAGLVYGESRIDAVSALLDAISARYRMGPDKALEVVPAAGVASVWTLAGGEDGVLIRTVRSLSDEGVYNAAISRGETASGKPLVGRAYIKDGPLAWGGPFGRVPVFHRAVSQTAAGVQADADTTLANRVAAGEVDLAVTCLAHPGLQPNDRVTVVAASRAGDAELEGRVVGMRLVSATSDAGATPAKAMSLTVRVSVEALEAVAARVRRGR